MRRGTCTVKSVVTVPLEGKQTLKSEVKVPTTSTINVPPHRLTAEEFANLNYTEPCIKILMLGHSFVKRLRNGILDYMVALDGEENFQETLQVDGCGIIPYFYGKSGAMVSHLPQLTKETLKQFPSILIVDIGQNDLCWLKNDPQTVATDLYTEIQLMLYTYENLELVAICYATEKRKMKKGDKSLEKVNEHVHMFNMALLRLTRRDKRIMRWLHKGCTKPTETHSTDGTHPNTGYGFWRYLRSISALCKAAKKQMALRRTMSLWAIEKVKKAIRRKKDKARQFRKRMRALRAMEIGSGSDSQE